jgi:hypothetical protein
LLIGEAKGHPVLGAPGCARSPKENGFDWVLMRLLAGLPVPREDITGMGVGGLLMEIIARPQPRDEKRATALALAAGRLSRMGGRNKLSAEIGGRLPLPSWQRRRLTTWFCHAHASWGADAWRGAQWSNRWHPHLCHFQRAQRNATAPRPCSPPSRAAAAIVRA